MSQYIHALDVANKQVRPINCDSSGNLQVDIVSGGDATAANQVTNHNKLDSVTSKLGEIDTAIDTIEACVTSNELAVSHGGLTELEAAINSSKMDVNVASDISHFQDGDAVSASSKGQLIMGRDNSNNAHPLHITSNGDLEVEIADFTKGQALMAASFPVVIASDQSALSVSSSVSRNQITVASGASITAG